MADKPDIRIVVGVDMPKTKSVVKEGLKVVAKQINQEQTVVNVKLGLDVNTTKKLFQDKLKTVVNGLKLDKVKIDLSNSINTKPIDVKVNTAEAEKQIAQTVANTSKQITKLNKEFFNKDSGSYYDTFVSKNKEALKSLNKDSASTKLVDSSIKEYESILNKIRTITDGSDKETLLNNEELAQSVSLLKQQENIIKNTLQVSRAETRNSNNTQKEINRLKDLVNTIDSYLVINDKAKKNAGFMSEVSSVRQEAENLIRDGESGIDLVANGTDKLVSRFSSAKQSIKSFGLEGQKWTTRLASQFEKLGIYFSAASVMMAAIGQMKQMVSSVVALDKVVTDLQVATGYTRDETRDLLDTYSEMGKQLGATTLDVAQSADTWLRQGYAIEETNTLIKNSMILSKLGQINSADAAKALTSSMKGYNVSVEDSIGIIDKFTAVDREAAVSAGYIATALAETATSARLAGVDLNKVTGYIAAIGETTQDGAESVGNFVKTLFARMGNIKAGNLIDPETSESLKAWAFIA